ncbi:MAG TPA: Flp family type IVb pilin [Candidatus Cybelea sp.]
MAVGRERRSLTALETLFWDDRAAAALEYGLLVALVALAALVAIQTVGGDLGSVFAHAAPHSTAAASGVLLPKR